MRNRIDVICCPIQKEFVQINLVLEGEIRLQFLDFVVLLTSILLLHVGPKHSFITLSYYWLLFKVCPSHFNRTLVSFDPARPCCFEIIFQKLTPGALALYAYDLYWPYLQFEKYISFDIFNVKANFRVARTLTISMYEYFSILVGSFMYANYE